jgi:hypothetical protein
MQPDEIKTGHRYFIGVHNGRRVVAHVTKVIDRPFGGVIADDGTASSRPDVAAARFRWRNAAYHSGWSRYETQLPITVFAQLATEEVAAV